MGGKSYKKRGIDDADAGAGAEEEKTEIGLEKLEIKEVQQKTPQSIEVASDKPIAKKEVNQKEETHRKEEVKKKAVWDTPWKKTPGVNEIRKPSWFFSGEDALKDG